MAASEAGTERKAPKPGDIKTFNGVEYIYGKNLRFPTLQGEPEYLWVRRDKFTPRPFDSLREAFRRPASDRGEIEELEKRISKLEGELEKLGTATERAGEGR